MFFILEMRVWTAVSYLAYYILGDISKVEDSPESFLPPSISIDVDKLKAMAWIGLIAADDTWSQQSSILLYVVKSDVRNSD